MRRSTLRLVALAVASAWVSVGVASPAVAEEQLPTEAELNTFRADFNRLLDGVETLTPQLERVNPQAREQMDALGYARAQFDALEPSELTELYDAVVNRYPELWNVPSDLGAVLEAIPQGGVPFSGLRTAFARADLATCDDSPGGQDGTCAACPANTVGSIRNVFIARAVSLVIEGVFEPIPDSLDIALFLVTITVPHPAKIIVGILLFVSRAIDLSLEGVYFVNDECETRFRQRNVNFYANETVTSRASADSLDALGDTIKELKEEGLILDIEAHLVRRRTAISEFQLPTDRVCSGDGSIVCTFDSTNPDPVAAQAAADVQCNVCSGNTALTCTGDADCCSAGGECLGAGPCVPRGLQLVRRITRTAIDALGAAGEFVPAGAERSFNLGDQFFGAEEWKRAYERYRKAYRRALK